MHGGERAAASVSENNHPDWYLFETKQVVHTAKIEPLDDPLCIWYIRSLSPGTRTDLTGECPSQAEQDKNSSVHVAKPRVVEWHPCSNCNLMDPIMRHP